MDGADGAAAPITNMANTPIESIEAEQPLLITQYGLVPDTAGPGKFRGGLGIIREYELLAEKAQIQIRSDRTKFLPYGAQGGSPGSRTYSIMNPDTDKKVLPSKFLTSMKKGEVYRLIQAGAGGYGDPLERDPDAVVADATQGKVTLDHAKEAYGVVLKSNPLSVDKDATEKLRAEMLKTRGPLSLDPEIVVAES